MISNLPLFSQTMTAAARASRSLPAIWAVWIVFAVFACALTGRPAQAEVIINVSIDQAKVVALPAKTSTVIIGNPIIADVTILKQNNAMVLTGKGFGETNLIALDAQGNSIGESIVRVRESPVNVIVQRGMDRQSYSCSSRCEPTVSLGDDPKYMNQVIGQIGGRNGAAQSGASAVGAH